MKIGSKKPRVLERELHATVAAFLARALGQPTFWTTFPAGGGGVVRGGFLKRAGLKAGVPDIMIIHAGKPFFVELKTATGRLSAAQILTHAEIAAAGGNIATCRSLLDVAYALKSWGIPMKFRPPLPAERI